MKFFDDVLSDETLNFYHKEFEIISQHQRWGLSDLNWSDNIKVGITGVSDLEVFWRENIKGVPREVGLDE